MTTDPALAVLPGGRDETARRIAGAVLGLAAGDAAGWPAARHRSAVLPPWTRRLAGELDRFAELEGTTALPVPLALNVSPAPLALGPSDDAEWAAWTALAVLAADGTGDEAIAAALRTAWLALADRADDADPVPAHRRLRARISVRAALANLAAGLRPPVTGHDNPHYFDDAACPRAVVLAALRPGEPERAADLAAVDARYTQDGDGVHGARAVAAAVAAALGGAGTHQAVRAAVRQLPPDTEIGRNAAAALDIARDAVARSGGPGHRAAFTAVPLLEPRIIDHVYSYGVAAAETVPVALALTWASGGDLTAAVPAAACLSRIADSAPSLTGALTGAVGGIDTLPDPWARTCATLLGCAHPDLEGHDLAATAARLAALAPHPPCGPRNARLDSA
ncbi:ADP-ribosylglycohydrolase family protein [Streptomyces sp. SL13]|uniref:ADP-ribosylglycohydrolase family protein n=1 Tax=Streptantibioticus silvisoli TaxID=2705255 RepID=A0AA90KAN5_9ACTN|nr:ADP-ribosylglycohydrolase family protein [Streptantibioticus silvisoli]MDI5961710.1 ADP-ribosylglycohydrolase family protein [Streptantibioticus silvisoli]MDI5972327.1 ADP-ribosylglycohydrolase family protein [Streptantibioticus silvisoli]